MLPYLVNKRCIY